MHKKSTRSLQNAIDSNPSHIFNQFKSQLQKIARESKENQNFLKAQKRMANIKSPLPQQQSTIPVALVNNIVFDCLRCYNYNYSYSIMMQQSNTIPEQVVSKAKLATLLSLNKQYEAQQSFSTSIIELILKKIDKMGENQKNMQNAGIQCEIISNHSNESGDKSAVMEDRLRQVREEVQQREKKYYEKMLETMRAREIMELRVQITQQYESRLKKQKQQQDKQIKQVLSSNPNNQQTQQLISQNASLLAQTHTLSNTISILRSEIESLKTQQKAHDCKLSAVYVSLQESIKTQHKELQNKKKELDLALRNINTKIEDLVDKKRKIEGSTYTDRFVEGVRKARENKDYLIQTVFAEMKNMEHRVAVVGKDNQELRGKLKELTKMNKSLEQYSRKVSQQNSQLQSREPSPTPSIYSMPPNIANPRSEPPQRTSPRLKPPTFNISIGVTQSEIDTEMKALEPVLEESQSRGHTEEEGDLDDFMQRQLQHDRKLLEYRLKIEGFRRKVLTLVDQDQI